MMAIFYQGDPLMVDYTPGSAVTSGDVVVQGSFPMVAHRDIAAFALGALAMFGGVYQIPADAGTVVAFGDVYWDATAKKVTLTAAGNTHFGISLSTTVSSGDLAYVLHLPNSALVSVLSQPNAANTNITTAGAGTLTAAAIVSRIITRSGPVAAFTDTTDTAALIVAALPSALAGQSFRMTIKNTTAFAETLAAGAGVTLSGQTIIPPNSVGEFLVSLTSLTAVAIRGLFVSPMTTAPLLASTALTTVGAGTITAAGIAGGVTARTGSTAAFTDTTDTGANIQAALPNANVGQSWTYVYQNNTKAPATLAGGAGVTVSGVTIVPQGCWAEYLCTLTAASTVTMVGVAMGANAALPYAQRVINANGNATAAAGDCTGAAMCEISLTANNANAYTLRTAAQMFADIADCQVGFAYWLLVSADGNNTVTVTAPDANTTITGTATVATGVKRLYHVIFTAATTMTLTNCGALAA